MSITVQTKNGPVKIIRNQDNNAVISPGFAKTSRKCPPFCVQPQKVAPGVETVGELEVVKYMEKGGLIIDARTVECAAALRRPPRDRVATHAGRQLATATAEQRSSELEVMPRRVLRSAAALARRAASTRRAESKYCETAYGAIQKFYSLCRHLCYNQESNLLQVWICKS